MMTGKITQTVLSIMMLMALMACLVIPAQAKVPVNIAIMLKNGKLTPVGANPMGNAEGTIPAWEGGLSGIPKHINWNEASDERRPDPFADDKILFTITAQNVDQYADKLSKGLLEMFKRYPDTWKMHIYPTRRSAAYSERVYKGTYDNALKAEVLKGGDDGATNFYIGFPFPIPKNGVEAIHNHIFRPMGVPGLYQYGEGKLVHPDGSFVRTSTTFLERIFMAEKVSKEEFDPKDTVFSMLIKFTDPPGRKGEVLLANSRGDYSDSDRGVWIYMPGQRRVRRAPNYGYDGEDASHAGLYTIDDVYMYNSRPDRQDWKLKGKKEMFIGYNNYMIDLAPLESVLTPYHLNPEFLRWELHRVWVVEATLKEGYRHCYGKRVFYMDEDSWIIHLKDQYDRRGNLWRYSFITSKEHYDYPAYWIKAWVNHDLQQDNYIVQDLINDLPREKVMDPDLSHFKPQYLRQMGRR